ncbi:HNH endonuclease signature motif containing protein [Clostridium sp. MB40-C1]|uniref:HNH endonuclease n=1 Tax=Clostridium sp. MB40-C1 TaxID=3070996 RepID=UPI0027DF182B|nr:HNH endonuclease signature motif containing protein [Clostridium sp. MB40-C1]WMJ81921.1 HNH endonuclease signature motif containing protein [Clostridium sp. MB40-C1]
MGKCIICGAHGERHHIVYKNQGGIDIPLNYVYLCSEHHRGKLGPHKNRSIDYEYKKNFQNKLFHILKEEYYSMNDLKKLLKINPFQGKILEKKFKKYKNGYKKIEIIKILMGGKLYF